MNLDNIKELSQLQQEYLRISNQIKINISNEEQECIKLAKQNYIDFFKSKGFETEELNQMLISSYMETTIRLSCNLLKLEILKPIAKSYNIQIKKFEYEDYTPVSFNNPQTNEEILVEIDKLKKDIKKANETLKQNGRFYFVLEEGNKEFNTFDTLLEDVFK